MIKAFIPGQRWLSEAEPELGLGMVLSSTAHQVTVVYRASGTTRQYSIEHAPLKRVLFREGETIRGGEDEKEYKVSAVRVEKVEIGHSTRPLEVMAESGPVAK